MLRKIQAVMGVGFLSIIGVFAPNSATAESWKLTKDTDPFTDETVAVATASDSGNPTRSLVVRCKGTKFSVYVNFGEYLSNKSVVVRYRVDKQETAKEEWHPSTSGSAAFVGEEKHFARLIVSGNSLLVEALDYRGVAHRASFSLTGSAEAIGPVMEQCGVSRVGLHDMVDGLRLDMALRLERWGPRNISTYKKILISLEKYNGFPDASIEPEFALAVQDFYDTYIHQCRNRQITGTNCDILHIMWENNLEPIMPLPSSVIYERASGELKDQAGKLHLGE